MTRNRVTNVRRTSWREVDFLFCKVNGKTTKGGKKKN